MLQTILSYIDINGEQQSGILQDLLSKSKKTLLFFYPKNDTPGCILENKDFYYLKDSFNEKGIQLIAVSKDSPQSHVSFRNKFNLGFIQISDGDLALHNHFGAYGEKNNYGKIVSGVIRSTYLLDTSGEVLQSWKNVKAKGHAEKVLREIV